MLGTPNSLKQAFEGSGFYDTAVSGALDQAQEQKDGGQTGETNIPIDNADVRGIIENAFPPESLQTQVEGVLDSIYAWLRGETPDLRFNIDLTDAKMRLADGMGAFVQQRLASLPACTAADLPIGSDIDPFNATCAPPGYDTGAAVAETRQTILGGEFLKDSNLTAENIKNEEGKSLADQLSAIPAAYQNVSWALWASLLAAILAAAAVVFLSVDRRSGLRKLGLILAIEGAVIAVLAWLGAWGLKEAVVRSAISNSDAALPLQQSALKLVQLLANDLRFWWMAFGLITLAIGAGILIALYFTRSKTDKNPAAPATSQPEPEPKPVQTPKPKPRNKKLVQ